MIFEYFFKTERIPPSSKTEKKFLIIALIIAFILTILDQVTKATIVKYIELHKGFPVIDGFFDIVHVKNNGAAWNTLAGQQLILTSISLIAFFAALFFVKLLCEGWKERYIAFGMVLSGIVGNLIDRMFRDGLVVDFLDFYIKDMHWPAFNVADMGITVGMTIFIISSFLRPEVKKDK